MKIKIAAIQIVFVVFWIMVSVFPNFNIIVPKDLIMVMTFLILLYILWILMKYKSIINLYSGKINAGKLIIHNPYFMYAFIYFTLNYFIKEMYTLFLEPISLFSLLLIISFVILTRITIEKGV